MPVSIDPPGDTPERPNTVVENGPAVTPSVRKNMQANRGRDTGPERAIRTHLHELGLRYRVNLPLPFNQRRRADITFTRAGLFVFIDGCFWHGCPQHFVVPKTRRDFWLSKIRANQARDRDTDSHLERMGFISLRIWEHEDPRSAADRIETVYRFLTP